MGCSGSFPGVKLPECDVDRSTLSSVEIKEWSYTSAPLICLHGVERDNFTQNVYSKIMYMTFNIQIITDVRKFNLKGLSTP